MSQDTVGLCPRAGHGRGQALAKWACNREFCPDSLKPQSRKIDNVYYPNAIAGFWYDTSAPEESDNDDNRPPEPHETRTAESLAEESLDQYNKTQLDQTEPPVETRRVMKITSASGRMG